jgi:hypothetical protein
MWRDRLWMSLIYGWMRVADRASWIRIALVESARRGVPPSILGVLRAAKRAIPGRHSG